MKRVFAYLRVSGLSQVDGDGFTRQLEAVTAFANSKGWVIARVFKEEGVSGTVESRERPQFVEALSLCGPQIDTIIVESTSRLARDLIVSEFLFLEARKSGAKIYAADTGNEYVDADVEPTRLLIRQVLGAIDQWDKSTLVKKLRAARDRKRLETGRCEGFPGVEVTHPEIAAKVIELREVKGKSFIQIARNFNYVDRVPKPPTLRAKLWSPETLRLIYVRATSHRTNFNALERAMPQMQ